MLELYFLTYAYFSVMNSQDKQHWRCKVASIHFSDPSIGSISWELPADLASALDEAPHEGRILILTELENQIKAYVLMLMGALKMGPDTAKTFELIDSSQRELLKRLIAEIKA